MLSCLNWVHKNILAFYPKLFYIICKEEEKHWTLASASVRN